MTHRILVLSDSDTWEELNENINIFELGDEDYQAVLNGNSPDSVSRNAISGMNLMEALDIFVVTHEELQAAKLALDNIRMLAKRIHKTDPENAEHLLRFCEEGGSMDPVLRSAD